MLKFRARRADRTILAIGLNKNEIGQMLRGERLTFKMESLRLPEGDVVLFAGETDSDLQRNVENVFGRYRFSPDANMSIDPLALAKEVNSK